MKIMITTAEPNIESSVDSRFGRASYLLVVNPDTLEWQAHPNPGINSPGGAGITAAQFVAKQKMDAVISGGYGPHAVEILNTANVPMYLFGTATTVRDVVARFTAGRLEIFGTTARVDLYPESKD
jgi:predicted Fe-Mo cluster-binding NifX family protein